MKAGTGRKILILAATLVLSACGGGGGGSVSPSGSSVVTFTSWNTDLAGKTVKVDGQGKQVAYTYDSAQQKITGIEATKDAAASALFTFDGSSVLTQLAITSTAAGSPAGFTGDTISNLLWGGVDQDFVIVENAAGAGKAVVSDPRSGVWNYQSFGVWETYTTATTGDYGAMSLGANSSATAIPGSGTATFEGKVVGSYVNAAGEGHTALADLTVVADFGIARSLNFSTSSTTISANDGGSITLRNDLNLTGILNIADPANSFSGTLYTTGSGSGTVLSGESTGQFYGPNAEELGGVFFLNRTGSLETYSGAYGATLTP